jgi:hypothetical protein
VGFCFFYDACDREREKGMVYILGKVGLFALASTKCYICVRI